MATIVEKDKFAPGGSTFGSFIDYYRFHPTSTRINCIPSSLLTDVNTINDSNSLIDIGCNAGVKI